MGLLDRVQQVESGVTPESPGAFKPAAPASPPVAPEAPTATAPATPPSTDTAPPEEPQRRVLADRLGVTAPTGNLAQRTIPSLAAAKAVVHGELLDRYADALDVSDTDFVKEKLSELIDDYFRANPRARTEIGRDRLLQELCDDVLGLGPLEILLNDPTVVEIMINHPKQIYIERNGEAMLSDIHFESDKQLLRVIDRIVSSIGRRVDESNPMCDARLKDGSRVNVVLPPLALFGPCMTIRKFSKDKLTNEDLIQFGTGTRAMFDFLKASVKVRLNILVSGGGSSGKTTLLNVLSSFIPEEERIVTCEDAAELQLQQEHVITLESRPPNVEGTGAIVIRDLVRNCLRMRPDRIVIGECRSGEALDMLQAMNTGHEGSMSTVHAKTPIEALGRLETLVLTAGSELPSRAIREQMAAAIHLIVQQQRLRGGVRRIMAVTEVTGLNSETGELEVQDLFVFKQVGINAEGRAVGYHTATGNLPVRLDHFKSSGEELDTAMFEPTPQPEHDRLY
jgi:pilus assembly protein CpaF